MMGEITEEQLWKVREPIPFTPTKRLSRDAVLYVMEEDIPHPIYGYAKYHKEYSVIDLRGYRKGYEPRLEISGIYTPNPEDTFRLQTGKLPPYQPTTTGDKLLAEMRRLGVYKAFRIGKPEVAPKEVPAVPEVTKLTGDIWNAMTPIEREQLGVKAKLDAERRGQYWIGLWGEEKRALIREFKKEQLAKPPAVSVVDYDRRYTLEELREKARQEGLSSSGSKKEIASKLIARGIK